MSGELASATMSLREEEICWMRQRERRERVTLFALRVTAMGPALGLIGIARGLIAGSLALSKGVLMDSFNLLFALVTLGLASLEVHKPVVELRGFWKPDRRWLIASVLLAAYGVFVMLKRSDTAGWVVTTWGILTAVRCLRDLAGAGSGA